VGRVWKVSATWGKGGGESVGRLCWSVLCDVLQHVLSTYALFEQVRLHKQSGLIHRCADCAVLCLLTPPPPPHTHHPTPPRPPPQAVHQAPAVMGIALIAMGEPLGSQMGSRMLEHLLQYGEPPGGWVWEALF
jgi:hypothetical protein